MHAIRYPAVLAVFAVLLLPSAPASAADEAGADPSTQRVAAVPPAEAGQYRASKVIGTAIYNGRGERVGAVEDLIVSGDGRPTTVVVGVGGFLGVGEHSVGIPYGQVAWANQRPPRPGKPARDPADAADRWYPDHGTIHASRDDLARMPAFKY